MTQQKVDPIGEQSDRFSLRFPPGELDLDQDEEWCEVKHNGQWSRIRFHDYHEIYAVPGLYEAIFTRRLKCCSPQRVVGLFDDVLSDFPQNPQDLRVLDIGAGNGMVGQEFRHLGVRHLYGVDIIAEAREAASRDRPDLYEHYEVADLTRMNDQQVQQLNAFRANCMSCVAALGYGDIPTTAFATAVNLVEPGGWLVFNIKETFLYPEEDHSGFSQLIHRLQQHQLIQIQAYRRYCHRLSIHGQPLHYVAIVASKLADVPWELLEDGA